MPARRTGDSPKKPLPVRPPLHFKEGTEVLALWRGSNRYFPAVVVERDEEDKAYRVKFEDGTNDWLFGTNVCKKRESRTTKVSTPKAPLTSPHRGRRGSRGRLPKSASPSRGESPGRSSPSRSRSPGRPKRLPVTRRSSLRRSAAVSSSTTTDGMVKKIELSSGDEETAVAMTTMVKKTIKFTQKRGKGGPLTPGATTPIEAMTAHLEKSLMAPKTKKYELGGPIGAISGFFFMPLLAYFLYFACGKQTCDLADIPSISLPRGFNQWLSLEAVVIVFGFVIFETLLYCIPSGKIALGSRLRDGSRLKYQLNGLFCLLFSVGVFGLLWYSGVPVTLVYDHFLQIMTVSSLLALIVSLDIYHLSFQPGVLLAEGGNTGNFFYDSFMGRRLNLRLGSMFDVKVLIFSRIMLIGIVFIGFGMMAKQFDDQGTVSLPMFMVCSMQFLYVLDVLVFEEDMLGSIDFVNQGLGFAVIYGCLVFGPLVYALQARFLVDHQVDLSYWQIAVILVLNGTGYVIFRRSNSQKSSYRRDPQSESSKKLTVLPTDHGTNLIISSYWGFLRHPNYLGDLMIAVSWCMCTGFQHIIPYFYVLFLIMLLFGRAATDDTNCRKKYGADWDAYCKIVPYKIIPYVF